MSDGGHWRTPAMAPQHARTPTTGLRLLSAVLLLELIWLLLVAASLVFLAAHLGGGTDELTGDAVSRRLLLFTVPLMTVALGLALIGARQAIEHRAAAPDASLSAGRRVALGIAALANAVLVASIAISLYHARTTWVVVGLALAAALATVAVSCVRAARL